MKIKQMLISGKKLKPSMFKKHAPKHLTKRIYDLRQRGFKIKTEKVKGEVVYSLDPKTPKKLLK